MHAPSQPLMRSLLSQFQTPTAPRRVRRFFRVWSLFRLPCRTDHPAYFGLTKFSFESNLSAVDGRQVKCFSTKCQRPFSVQTAQKNAGERTLHSIEQLGVAELHL